ncbi:MAG: hypothetical protein JNK29_11350 [Anaerolineales bacterium]|nr:hypothetical protein [Anaerolineales bacterium]
MSAYFLGADLGGSKTHVLIADEAGQALGFGQAPAGNHETVGYAGLTAAVRAAAGQALAQAGLRLDQITAAGLGIGGYDWPSELADHQAALAAAGLTMPLEVVNDAVAGLLAGARHGWGLGLVAGTSCNCWGRDPHGRLGRMIGMGARVGEYGGASELVRRAVQAVARAWTRRGPATRLADVFVAHTGAADVADFLERFSVGALEVGPEAAPRVVAAAAEGDRVAAECVAWAGQGLADLALGVARQLDLPTQAFEVVLIGSLVRAGPLLIDPLRAALTAEAPGAQLTALNAPPVLGGVVLALQVAGRPTVAARERLAATTPALRA